MSRSVFKLEFKSAKEAIKSNTEGVMNADLVFLDTDRKACRYFIGQVSLASGYVFSVQEYTERDYGRAVDMAGLAHMGRIGNVAVIYAEGTVEGKGYAGQGHVEGKFIE